jgi:hypothetical protein
MIRSITHSFDPEPPPVDVEDLPIIDPEDND